MCCFNSGNTFINSGNQTCCGMCSLEPSVDGTMMSSRPQGQQAGPVKLEGADSMVVLFRVVNRQVERVRVFSEDCQLDAGGREVTWLTGVKPAESVALLESLIGAQVALDRRDRIVDGAISAIALHEDAVGNGLAGAAAGGVAAAADPREGAVLARQHARPARPRDSATGHQGGHRGRSEEEGGVRHLTEPRAAGGRRAHRERQVQRRGRPCAAESIFWLAQKAGNKAAAAITERIEQDPDTEVKKKAVFALSQLPKDEGVPLAASRWRARTRIPRCGNRRCSGSDSRRIRARWRSSRRF